MIDPKKVIIQEVVEEGGGDLEQQVWEKKQAGIDNEGGPLIGTINFDEATLEKIRSEKGKGKEL